MKVWKYGRFYSVMSPEGKGKVHVELHGTPPRPLPLSRTPIKWVGQGKHHTMLAVHHRNEISVERQL